MSTYHWRSHHVPQRSPDHRTAPLGEVVTTAFDKAGRFDLAPREVSRLAAQAVSRIVRGRKRVAIVHP